MEDAEAEEQRLADEDLRVLRERAAKAKARKESAEREAARIEADAKRATAEAERARREDARRRAAKEAEDAERTAAEAEAVAAKAATAAASGRSSVPASPAATRHPVPPPPAGPELTPLGRLFQQRLADVVVERPAHRPASPRDAAPAPSQNRDPSAEKSPRAGATGAAAPPTETPTAVPPPDPVDALPPLTGADLTSYRTWLGVSQRALAIKFAVEQSVISKSEGKPASVLPPQLRKALHQAMGVPRPDAGGAS